MNVKLSDIVKDTCIIICDSNEQLVQVCIKLDELIRKTTGQRWYGSSGWDLCIYISDKQYTTFTDIESCGNTTNKFSFNQININE